MKLFRGTCLVVSWLQPLTSRSLQETRAVHLTHLYVSCGTYMARGQDCMSPSVENLTVSVGGFRR
jgi:hypothetical protein